MRVNKEEYNANEQLKYLHAFFLPEAIKHNTELFIFTELDNENAYFLNDKEKLYAILINIIKNAIKFTDNGIIRFGYTIKDNEIKYFVSDTGIGIPEDKLEAIFDRFVQADLNFSRSYEGAGLGLSITKAYVELLGGKISVESILERVPPFTLHFLMPPQGERKLKMRK